MAAAAVGSILFVHSSEPVVTGNQALRGGRLVT
jgi:hypothetical protein